MKKNNGPVRGDTIMHDAKTKGLVAGANKKKQNFKPTNCGYKGKSVKMK